MNKNIAFYDFIDHSSSQKEVSLIIAQDEKEQSDFITSLQRKDFRQVHDIYEMLTNITFPSKVFFVVKGNLSKEIYDFILQYPTGQIETFDSERMKNKVTIPSYESSILFIITKENLAKVQKESMRLLENVGIAYQN